MSRDARQAGRAVAIDAAHGRLDALAFATHGAIRALSVVAALLDRHAEPEVAGHARPAVDVALAFGRRQEDALTRDAALARCAVAVVPAAVGCDADVVDADVAGQWAIPVTGAEERRDAAPAGAAEAIGAIIVAAAHDRLAAPVVAPLVLRAVRIGEAVGSRPANIRRLLAVLVLGAVAIGPAEVHGHAFVTQATLATSAVGVVATARILDAALRERIANQSERRTIDIAVTAPCLDAEAVDARQQRRAFGVDAALAIELTQAVFANLAVRARPPGAALTDGHAQEIDTAVARRAAHVILAFAREHAAVANALESAPALRVRLAFDREDALEVLADQRCGALAVFSALAGEDAATTATALAGIAVVVGPTFEHRNAGAVDADGVVPAVAVDLTSAIGYADTVAADLTDVARSTRAAFGRRTTFEVFADEVARAVPIVSTLASEEADAVAAHLGHPALPVVATLWGRNALAGIANLAGIALLVDQATFGDAAPGHAGESRPAVAVALTAVVAGHALAEHALFTQRTLIVARTIRRGHEDADAEDAVVVRRTVDIALALIAGSALAVDALEGGGTVARPTAREFRDTPARDARHTRTAIAIVSAATRHASPELALFLGPALVIVPATDGRACALDATVACRTLVVAAALRRLEAPVAAALATRRAVAILSALDRDALVPNADLLAGTVVVDEALGRHTDRVATNRVGRAFGVALATGIDASVVLATTAFGTLRVEPALGHEDALIALTARAERALVVATALGPRHADFLEAFLTRPAVAIPQTFRGSNTLSLEADLERWAIAIIAAAGPAHAPAIGALEPVAAIAVIAALQCLDAAVLLTYETRRAIRIDPAIRIEAAHTRLADEIGRAIPVALALGRGNAFPIRALAAAGALLVAAAAHRDAFTVDARLERAAICITAAADGAHAPVFLTDERVGTLRVVDAIGRRSTNVVGAHSPQGAIGVAHTFDAGPAGIANQRRRALRLLTALRSDAAAALGLASQLAGAIGVTLTARDAKAVDADPTRLASRIVVAARLADRHRADALAAYTRLAAAAIAVNRADRQWPSIATSAIGARRHARSVALTNRLADPVDAAFAGAAHDIAAAVGQAIDCDANVRQWLAQRAIRAQTLHALRPGHAFVLDACTAIAAIDESFAFEAGSTAAGRRQKRDEESEGDERELGRARRSHVDHHDLFTISARYGTRPGGSSPDPCWSGWEPAVCRGRSP